MRPAETGRDPLPYDPGPDGPEITLLDGPPYANGRLHMGHTLNKLLKDMVLRDRRRQGYHAPLLANWDCHGLPLEQRFTGKRERFATTTSYLAVVEAEARKWARVQSDEFLELGVGFTPLESSLSCDPRRQALVMHEFHRLVQAGLVSRKQHPSSWSPVDGTVLAGAETEETERQVPTVTTLFPVQDVDGRKTSLAVWTTTPWSLPGNTAVAYNPDYTYALYAWKDEHLVALPGTLGVDVEHIRDLSSGELQSLQPQHPLADAGYPLGQEAPLLMPASFVTGAKGTGLVHVGPAHAREDSDLWKEAEHTAFPNVVGPDGRYQDDLPLFGGMSVVDGDQLGPANEAVLAALEARGALFERRMMTMTLEVSWRSGGLLVTRATPQWFVDLADAKKRALEAVRTGKVAMVPEKSRARLTSMLSNRPDWLVSRQREWGVPLGLYVHKETGEPCTDPALLHAVQEQVRQNGLAGWWDVSAAEHFAAAGRNDHHLYDKITDVLDVWFDSACVPNYGQPAADLVLEGSDQHRGWYSSMLLKAMALGDELPFKTVMTHGFVVTADRRKMSKSKGNGMTPAEALKKWSRDVLRLWVAHVDVTEDVPLSNGVLDEAARTRKSMRNTMRYLTGVLRDWTEEDEVATPRRMEDMLLLAELQELTSSCDEALESYDMRRRMELVRDFLDHRLSGFHLDARKDLLYCRQGTERWHQARHTLMLVYGQLLRLLDPLCPDLVAEMTAALAPLPLPAVPPYAHLLPWRERLAVFSQTVGLLAEQDSLKLKDIMLELGQDETDLMVAFGPEFLARMLKVDEVQFTGRLHGGEAMRASCPRCRLHRVKDATSWCSPCQEYLAP